MAHYKFFEKKERKLVYALVSFGLICACIYWITVHRFAADILLGEPLGRGLNPPGVTLIIYSICIVCFIYNMSMLCENSKRDYVKKIYSIMAWIGHYSLYIFLYHLFVLNYILIPYVDISNIWIKRFVYVTAMIFIPILFKLSKDKIAKALF